MAHRAPSPTPGLPQTATKARVAAVGGFLFVFIAVLLTVWTDTDPLTARDVVFALGSAIGTSLGLGTAVYKIPNSQK